MEFEWDEDKRRKNLAKHGRDFAEVALLDWEAATIVEDNRRDYQEQRYWAFMPKDGRLLLVAFVIRARKIRIISFRKANKREIRIYGEAQSA